jgi:hypothetical protein
MCIISQYMSHFIIMLCIIWNARKGNTPRLFNCELIEYLYWRTRNVSKYKRNNMYYNIQDVVPAWLICIYIYIYQRMRYINSRIRVVVHNRIYQNMNHDILVISISNLYNDILEKNVVLLCNDITNWFFFYLNLKITHIRAQRWTLNDWTVIQNLKPCPLLFYIKTNIWDVNHITSYTWVIGIR